MNLHIISIAGRSFIYIHFTGLKTPKGFPLTARVAVRLRTCAYSRYPGNVMNKNHNPKGVASQNAAPEATPLGLTTQFASIPGVARIRATPGCKRQPPLGLLEALT